MTVEDGLKLVISMGLVFPDRPLQAVEETVLAPVRETNLRQSA
jgi:uncharacterized membrane protein